MLDQSASLVDDAKNVEGTLLLDKSASLSRSLKNRPRVKCKTKNMKIEHFRNYLIFTPVFIFCLASAGHLKKIVFILEK